MSEDFKEQLETLRKLKMLYEDPHPGLFTWCEAVHHLRKEISEGK